jgi:DNA polymerase-1
MPAARRVRYESVAKLDELRRRLFELAGGPFSLGSSQQLERVLQDRDVDLSGAKRTPTGLLARSAQALERIDDDLVRLLKEHRDEDIFHRLFDGLIKRVVGERLFGSFHQVGAETGRMSSGDPNLQNIPSSDLRARYCICAPPGKVLVGADLSAVELRVTAAYAPGGALERDLAAGIDPHQRVADEFGVDRGTAKSFNFGVLYGAGAPRVASILGIDRAAARVALDRWYATYPEIARLKVKLARQIRRRGYIETIGGRRHYADRANHMTVNYLVQGSAADLFKAAIAELHAAGCPLILFVHDEIVCEVDEDQAESTAALLEATLPQTMERGEVRVDNLIAKAEVHRRWSDFKQPGWTPWEARPSRRAPLTELERG